MFFFFFLTKIEMNVVYVNECMKDTSMFIIMFLCKKYYLKRKKKYFFLN
jgi:hypothetical protein